MRPPKWACSERARGPREPTAAGTAFARVLLLLTLACVGAAMAQAGQGLRLERAEFIADNSPQPPEGAAWQPVVLPDLQTALEPGVFGGWYRLDFHLDRRPDDLQALYLPTFAYAGEAYVNGHLVGRSATADRPEFARVPHLFTVSPSLLQEGHNRVALRMQWKATFPARLGPVYIGPQSALAPRQKAREWLAITGLQLLAVFSATLGLFMLVLWAKRRDETTLGWFGVAALSYTAYLSDFLFIGTPGAPGLGMPIQAAGSALVDVATVLFAMRYAGWRWPRAEMVLWGYVPLRLHDDISSGLWWGGPVMPYISLVVVSLWVLVFASVAWRRRNIESFVLLLASPGCLITDVWLSHFAAPDAVNIVPYSFLPLFVVMGWLLVSRFARSLAESERLGAQLEERVSSKHAELEQNYARMEQLTRQAAVVQERQRIMSDMHDGIGGQLISTLSLVEHGEASMDRVAAALRECIDDLRLAIDSLEPTDDDLLPVLGSLRYRLEGRLKQQGIALDWQVQEVPRLACLTPQNVLHILRILQEALTNVLKHAQATRVGVATMVDEGCVRIRVSDNGRGFAEQGRGRGLANMRDRARTLGGKLEIVPSAAGTTLSLLLPIC